MVKISIEKLEIFARHGVYDFEKENGQNFYIDLDFYTNDILQDDILQTVNYATVVEKIKEFFTKKSYDLIEFCCNDLSVYLLKQFDKIVKLDLTVSKPNAPIVDIFSNISTSISRGWHKVYIATGSNLGDKENYILTAINEIKHNDNFRFIKQSTLISTKPYGVTDQPDFINGAICVDTLLSPNELLTYLQSLEKKANRVKLRKWGERTLDLDILMYDNLVMFTPDLKIPHPEMHIRDFVLTPLKEIEPYLVHPIKNKSVTELLNDLQK